MSLPVIFSKIGAAARSVAGTGLTVFKKKAPEIMIGTGLAGFALTVFQTVKATNKTNDILEDKDRRLNLCEKNLQDYEEPDYSEEDYSRDVAMINKQTKIELIKTWGIVATTGISSAVLILGGYRVLNGRYVATAAAYKVLESGYDRYRQNVIGEFGKDVDWRMANNVKAEDLEAARKEREYNEQIAEENKKRLIKKRPRTSYQDINSRIFDAHSDRWRRYWTPSQALEYVGQVEREMQDKLRLDKVVLWNDVLERLGMPKTAEGAVVGWVWTKHNPHELYGTRLSLGFANDETPEDEIRKILSVTRNEDIWIRLRPNCDGIVYQYYDSNYVEKDYLTGECREVLPEG